MLRATGYTGKFGDYKITPGINVVINIAPTEFTTAQALRAFAAELCEVAQKLEDRWSKLDNPSKEDNPA